MNFKTHGHLFTRTIFSVDQLNSKEIQIIFYVVDDNCYDSITLSPEEFSKISTALIVEKGNTED